MSPTDPPENAPETPPDAERPEPVAPGEALPEGASSGAASPGAGVSQDATTETTERAKTPYGNLLVPLVVVPAIIVMVLVLVFVFFAGIVGEESSPQENLRTMLDGGKNARQQAAFNLVRQTLEAWEAEAAGEEVDFDLDQSFVPELNDAWQRTEEDEVPTRLVLAILLAGQGDPTGVDHLVDLLDLPERLDPGGQFRFKVVGALGLLGAQIDGVAHERAAEALIGLVDHSDEGLRGAAVVSLQNFPGPKTLAALQSVLSSSSLVLRGNAALALAELGNPAGEQVLLELIETEPYEVERHVDGHKWASQRLVSDSRQRALKTLVALGRAPERSVLERFRDDGDLEFRGEVLGLLADAE